MTPSGLHGRGPGPAPADRSGRGVRLPRPGEPAAPAGGAGHRPTVPPREDRAMPQQYRPRRAARVRARRWSPEGVMGLEALLRRPVAAPEERVTIILR